MVGFILGLHFPQRPSRLFIPMLVIILTSLQPAVEDPAFILLIILNSPPFSLTKCCFYALPLFTFRWLPNGPHQHTPIKQRVIIESPFLSIFRSAYVGGRHFSIVTVVVVVVAIVMVAVTAVLCVVCWHGSFNSLVNLD